jgi:RNA recognition motif-containing protein
MADHPKGKAMDSTLFVRGLPFDFTDAQLEGIFENIGPIKEGFVVPKKDGEGNRGFG